MSGFGHARPDLVTHVRILPHLFRCAAPFVESQPISCSAIQQKLESSTLIDFGTTCALQGETIASRPPLPPFTRETAIQRDRLAEDGLNSRDTETVSLAYTLDSSWRNLS